MNRASRIWIACFLGASSIYASSVLAQTPPDSFYSGGPDDYDGLLPMSETWTIQSHIPDVGHTSMVGMKFTLRRQGAGPNPPWFLDPSEELEWTPPTIPLVDHPDWIPGGVTLQWRWISQSVVQIGGHAHRVCVGFPVLNGEPRRDDDTVWIAFVDNEPGEDPDCGDPTEQHPGHAGAGR
jgi:hypothetical protein